MNAARYRRSIAAATACALLVFGATPAWPANDGPEMTRVPYASSRVPTLLCSTIYGCEIILEVGEQLRLASLNDDRWSAKVESAGTATGAARILIVPGVADQPAADGLGRQPLQTAFHALTDRREYVVDLRATGVAVEHRLGFVYDAPAVVVRAPAQDPALASATPVPVAVPRAETPPLDPARMNFGWRVSGSPEIRCAAVFSYGEQVWCALPAGLARTPIAYYADGRKDEPLNTHVVAQRYLVVDSLMAPIALELGGSHAARAVIERAP